MKWKETEMMGGAGSPWEGRVFTAGGSAWLGGWELERGGGCGGPVWERPRTCDSGGPPALHDEIKSMAIC